MLKNGDKVEYEGKITTCLSDEFKLFGTGPLVVMLEGFQGLVNAKLPISIEEGE
ncbi:hypothetical protein [Desulfuribacillus stibiiarsenatis]|uniref:hypothetical protein n=1 Tax=Desulfuribacillus stibiiarsenatis TaxID=1390249 RepID=UPI0015B6E24C|nr:hypothetical protein [Desulfuribacillus stibiiarsenatis]